MYFYFELASLCIGLFILEKLILMSCKKEYGPKLGIYLLTIMHLVFHYAALILWFILSKAKFTNSKFTATTGPIISIINLIFSTGTGALIIISTIKLVNHNKEEFVYTNSNCCKINPKILFSLTLFFIIFSGIFIILGISADQWIYNENMHGSLLKCDNCNYINGMSWKCLAGSECEINSDSPNCILYKDLANASDIYLLLETFTIFFLILSIQPTIALIASRYYGISLLNFVRIIYRLIYL